MTDLPYIIHLRMPDAKVGTKINGQVSGWGHWTDSHENCQGEFVSPLLTTSFHVVGSNRELCRDVILGRISMDDSMFCAAKNVINMDFPLASTK